MPTIDYTAILNGTIAGAVTLGAVWLAVAAKHHYDERRRRELAAEGHEDAEHDLDLDYLRLQIASTHFCENVTRIFVKVRKMIEKQRAGDQAGAEHFAEDIEVELATLQACATGPLKQASPPAPNAPPASE